MRAILSATVPIASAVLIGATAMVAAAIEQSVVGMLLTVRWSNSCKNCPVVPHPTAKLLVGLRVHQTRMTTSPGSDHRRQCPMWHPGSSEIATVDMMITDRVIHLFHRGSKTGTTMAMVPTVATALPVLLRALLLELLLGINNLLHLPRQVGSLAMVSVHTPECHRRRQLQALQVLPALLLELLHGINLLHPHHRVRDRRLRHREIFRRRRRRQHRRRERLVVS